MKPLMQAPPRDHARNAMVMTVAVFACSIAPDLLAQAAPSFGETGQKICGFFTNINSLLNLASIAVVTIAVIFAGYQIAFAQKRMADVAPILIGGLLIGAAAQIAKMLIGDNGGTQCLAMALNALPVRYA